MAGSITNKRQEWFGRNRSIVMKCISDAAGAVSGIGDQIQGGSLYAISYLPESGCTDNWDITITAKYNLPSGDSLQWADALGGQGADLSNSTNGDWKYLQKPFPILPGMIITPVIAGLGNAQSVWIVLHIWEEIRA